jgi:short-subunit dehydrogenase
MLAANRGWILNVSSVAAFQPAPRLAVYAATKAYVQSFTESLHEELRGTNVHATALCPGLTRTEFQSVSRTESYQTAYPAMLWLTAERVVAEGLAHCARGKAVSVPGWQYKSAVATTSVLPRSLLRRVSGMVQRG